MVKINTEGTFTHFVNVSEKSKHSFMINGVFKVTSVIYDINEDKYFLWERKEKYWYTNVVIIHTELLHFVRSRYTVSCVKLKMILAIE